MAVRQKNIPKAANMTAKFASEYLLLSYGNRYSDLRKVNMASSKMHVLTRIGK